MTPQVDGQAVVPQAVTQVVVIQVARQAVTPQVVTQAVVQVDGQVMATQLAGRW